MKGRKKKKFEVAQGKRAAGARRHASSRRHWEDFLQLSFFSFLPFLVYFFLNPSPVFVFFFLSFRRGRGQKKKFKLEGSWHNSSNKAEKPKINKPGAWGWSNLAKRVSELSLFCFFQTITSKSQKPMAFFDLNSSNEPKVENQEKDNNEENKLLAIEILPLISKVRHLFFFFLCEWPCSPIWKKTKTNRFWFGGEALNNVPKKKNNNKRKTRKKIIDMNW